MPGAAVGMAVAFQQGNTHASAPTGAELQDLVGSLPGAGVMLEQLLDLALIERQLGAAALPQFIIEQQPRQLQAGRRRAPSHQTKAGLLAVSTRSSKASRAGADTRQ